MSKHFGIICGRHAGGQTSILLEIKSFFLFKLQQKIKIKNVVVDFMHSPCLPPRLRYRRQCHWSTGLGCHEEAALSKWNPCSFLH